MFEAMSLKSSSTSGSDSSPEENSLYLAPSFVRSDRDEKSWRSYLPSTELMTTASAIFSHMSNPEDAIASSSSNQVSFLYDYYGMTEETRQDPPSPGHTSSSSNEHSNEAKNILPHSSAVEIPTREPDDDPGEMRHSFPESGKMYSFFPTHSSGEIDKFTHKLSIAPVLLLGTLAVVTHSVFHRKKALSKDIVVKIQNPPTLKRSLSSSIPSLRDKGSSCHSCSGSSTEFTSPEPQNTSKDFYQRPVFVDEKYLFILEAQTSVVQKRGEDSLTYLNKGQFYYIGFESKASKLAKVKSIIHLVFGHEKDVGTELAHWKYWYNQQPNPNQRAFDIDVKVCQNIDEEIEEVGYNALAFTWDPNNRAKISLRINCLSTDFSAQKGVKGIPLHLQIDTYEDFSKNANPIHRGFCQIKVFRDKGAERKNKDESRLVGKRMVKFLKGNEPQSDVQNLYQNGNKVTVLYSVSPLSRKPVVFQPAKERTKSTESEPRSPTQESESLFVQLSRDRTVIGNLIRHLVLKSVHKLVLPAATRPNAILSLRLEKEKRKGIFSLPFLTPRYSGRNNGRQSPWRRAISECNTLKCLSSKTDLENLDVYPRKVSRFVRRKDPAVTIYVRKEEEKAYNALMLDCLTLDELKQVVAFHQKRILSKDVDVKIQISTKYGVPFEMIKHVFKKTKKGFLVNMDDQLVERFVDEDDFIISINFDNQLGYFEVVFT